jgi:integrase
VKRRTRDNSSTAWQARIPSKTRPGKHDVKTFDRRRDAELWLSEEQTRRLRGETRDSAQPFRELVETWKRTRAARLASKTRERYSSITRTYLLPAFGSTRLDRLTRPALKEWFASEPWSSEGTARRVHTVLSSILSEGVELGLLRENPAARLRLATSPRRHMTILTAEEVRALAEAIPRPNDRLAVYVAAYTGLRAGELWALRARDADLPGRRLVVSRTLTSESGRLVFREATKTAGSRRVVSLPTFLVNMLAAQLPADPDALMFTSPGGGGGRQQGDPSPVRHELFRRRVFAPAARPRSRRRRQASASTTSGTRAPRC